MELQGTPPSDLTGKMTKWVAGSAGGPVIGVESSELSPSEAERGWTFPATACVTSIRTTPVLPYCPTRLESPPRSLHRRSFAFALAVARSSQLAARSFCYFSHRRTLHARNCNACPLPPSHYAAYAAPLFVAATSARRAFPRSATTTTTTTPHSHLPTKSSTWRARWCILPLLAAPTLPVSSPT
jgi:hypothetical protein